MDFGWFAKPVEELGLSILVVYVLDRKTRNSQPLYKAPEASVLVLWRVDHFDFFGWCLAESEQSRLSIYPVYVSAA